MLINGRKVGIHYSKVLNPKQCEEMHRFLSILSTYDRQAREKGVKLNIGRQLKEYRGYKTTEKQRAGKREYMVGYLAGKKEKEIANIR